MDHGLTAVRGAVAGLVEAVLLGDERALDMNCYELAALGPAARPAVLAEAAGVLISLLAHRGDCADWLCDPQFALEFATRTPMSAETACRAVDWLAACLGGDKFVPDADLSECLCVAVYAIAGAAGDLEDWIDFELARDARRAWG